METANLIVDKVANHSLSIGTRIYRIVYGVIIFILGSVIIAKKGFSINDEMSILGFGIIIIGIGSIIYGYIGKVIIKQKIRIYFKEEILKINRTFEPQLVVKLVSASLVKFSYLSMEITYDDYTKSYDFSFLNDKEFEKVKECIINYCSINNIEIEQ